MAGNSEDLLAPRPGGANISYLAKDRGRDESTWPIESPSWSINEKLALELIDIVPPDEHCPFHYLKWNSGLRVDLLRKAHEYDIDAMTYAIQLNTISSWFDERWLKRPRALDDTSVIEGYRVFLDAHAEETTGDGRCRICRALKPSGMALRLDCSFKDPKQIRYDKAKYDCVDALDELRALVERIELPDPYTAKPHDIDQLDLDADEISEAVDRLVDTVRIVADLAPQLGQAIIQQNEDGGQYEDIVVTEDSEVTNDVGDNGVTNDFDGEYAASHIDDGDQAHHDADTDA